MRASYSSPSKIAVEDRRVGYGTRDAAAPVLRVGRDARDASVGVRDFKLAAEGALVPGEAALLGLVRGSHDLVAPPSGRNLRGKDVCLACAALQQARHVVGE